MKSGLGGWKFQKHQRSTWRAIMSFLYVLYSIKGLFGGRQQKTWVTHIGMDAYTSCHESQSIPNAWWVICLFRLRAARLAAHARTDGRYPQHFTTRLQCNDTRQAWTLVAGNTECRKVKAIFLPGSTYEHPIPCWRLKEPFEGIYTNHQNSQSGHHSPSITLCHTLGHCSGYYQAPRFGSVEAVICTSWATAIWACWVLMALNSTCSTYRIQATDVMQPRYVCNFVQVRPQDQWNELCFRAVPKKYVASLWRQVAGTMAFAFAEAMDRLGVDLQTFLSQSYELQTWKEVTQVTTKAWGFCQTVNNPLLQCYKVIAACRGMCSAGGSLYLLSEDTLAIPILTSSTCRAV